MTMTPCDAFTEWCSYDWDSIADRDELHEAAEQVPVSWSLPPLFNESVPSDDVSRKRTIAWKNDIVANSRRERDDTPPAAAAATGVDPYALNFRHAERRAHEVCRLQNATRATVYDELFWLVFIAVRGRCEYERVTAPTSVLPAARFLTAQKTAVLNQQRHEQPRARTAIEEQVATAFMSQPTRNSRQTRMHLKVWCRHNLSIVLQWYADFFGRPIAFVHRGKGWCAEVAPSTTAPATAATAATTVDLHQWSPAANTVVLYLYDYSPMAQFGVELTLERALQLPWAQTLVRLHSFGRPMADCKSYTINDLQMLVERMRQSVDGADAEEDKEHAGEKQHQKKLRLYSTLVTAWMIF